MRSCASGRGRTTLHDEFLSRSVPPLSVADATAQLAEGIRQLQGCGIIEWSDHGGDSDMITKHGPIDMATQAMKDQRWATAPKVSPLRSDIRSGENFLIATSGNLPELFIGSVVVEWGFEVSRDRAAAFHAWLVENETSLASECPAGVQYRGTYGVFAQSERTLGSYRTVWSFASLAALELLAQEVAATSSFGTRVQALTAFRDESIGASRSQQIYHPAAMAQRT